MNPQTIKRFWDKVDKSGDCWIWTAAKIPQRYGLFQRQYAHRVSWELANGPILNNLHVLHKCDNPPCVNPKHLFLGTHYDNMKDAIKKGRMPPHKLTKKDVLEIRKVGPLFTQRKLAEIYGVSHRHICRILRGEKWAHI